MSTKTAPKPSPRKTVGPAHMLQRAVQVGDVVAALRPFGIKQRTLAQATGVSVKTIRNWKKTSAIRERNEDRLRDVRDLVLILLHALTPRGVGQWFNAHNRLLQGRRPVEALAGGDVKAVREAANAYVEGAYV